VIAITFGRTLCIVSPYSFEGSVIDFDELFKWANENDVHSVILSDTTLSGVGEFLFTAERCKKPEKINAVVGFRYNGKTYLALNTEELRELFKLYSMADFERLHDFPSIDAKVIYYLPDVEGQVEEFKTLCKYFGKEPELLDTSKVNPFVVIDDAVIEKRLASFEGYKLISNQNLPSASDDFLSQLVLDEKEYPERIRKEVKVIQEKGFADYFYTIRKIVEIAEQNHIEIGPGRGSAVGSLVAYRLGITKIDPVRYDLLFERFLNEGRQDYPDIDIDVEDIQRQALIELLRREFGYVYNISAFATMPKRFLRELQKDLANRLSKIPIQRTTHAAGLIISTTPIDAPLVPNMHTLEWDMDVLQGLGYVKFDILGLKTLSVYKELRNSLNVAPLSSGNGEDKGNKGDRDVYRYISTGFTDNVFQLDSPIGKSVARDVRPSDLPELALTISLNRPGPIRSGITDQIRTLKLQNARKYDIDLFNETYGLPLYQEQIMKLAMELAGFSSVEADAIRRAISKKDISSIKELYERLEEKLIALYGNDGKGLSKSILAFGEYAFNKSHAVAYAHLTYYMAYFKVKYPKLFYDTYLKYDTSVLGMAVYNLQSLGYKILPPQLFRTRKASHQTVETKRKDVYDAHDVHKVYSLPLYVIPGISVQKAEELENTKFNSFEHFVENSGLSFSIIEALIKAGTFDSFFESRRKAIQKLRDMRSGISREAIEIGGKLFGKVVQQDETKVEETWERTNMEYDILKVALTPPGEVLNKLAPYSLAYSLNLPYGVHVIVKAGFGSDGTSVFKINIPDGYYTLIYPERYEPSLHSVEYRIYGTILKQEISKSSSDESYEIIKLPDGKTIPNARPIMNNFKTVFTEQIT